MITGRVQCLRDNLDELLTCFRYHTLKQRKAVRTSYDIERMLRVVRSRSRRLGVFLDRISLVRILFAVFGYENSNQRVPTLFSLTQNI